MGHNSFSQNVAVNLIRIDNELTPDFLLETLAPFIDSLASLQHIIDELKGAPPSNIDIRSLTTTRVFSVPKGINLSMLSGTAVEIRGFDASDETFDLTGTEQQPIGLLDITQVMEDKDESDKTFDITLPKLGDFLDVMEAMEDKKEGKNKSKGVRND